MQAKQSRTAESQAAWPTGRVTAVKHILVVEDEEHLAIGIKYNLTAEGYRVTTVGDGASALRLFDEQPDSIDLVVLDLMLPGMSGYAVCEALRETGNNVPILMLSARTLAEDRIRGFDVGTDQYLEKPFDLDELLSRVRNLLHRRTGTTSPAHGEAHGETYEFDSAKINFDTYEVTYEGRPLRLTVMEIKLLRYFIEHEGSVVTRGELLENVWGLSTSITTRTVDNFIVRLRKYFEKDPARPKHFLSVRGAGYRFVANAEE
jgi:DNA-binding response OmpR family regulator